jgi:hypothetical protein
MLRPEVTLHEDLCVRIFCVAIALDGIVLYPDVLDKVPLLAYVKNAIEAKIHGFRTGSMQ